MGYFTIDQVTMSGFDGKEITITRVVDKMTGIPIAESGDHEVAVKAMLELNNISLEELDFNKE